MACKALTAFAVALLLSGGCAQNSSTDFSAPEKGDPDYLKGKNTRADELYVNTESDPDARDFRDVYIAPADLSSFQIIQPEGAQPDEEWQVSDVEDQILQKSIHTEFATALGFQSAYNIVDSKEQSEITVHTTVVAIHPHATRAQVKAGAQSGGAITASIALINSRSGEVMVRSVDTRSSDDIWAFHQVGNETPAHSLIFRSWGNSIRRGMLHLQGRSNDPLMQPIKTKEQ